MQYECCLVGKVNSFFEINNLRKKLLIFDKILIKKAIYLDIDGF